MTLSVATCRTAEDCLYTLALCLSEPLMDPKILGRAARTLAWWMRTKPRETSIMLAPFLRGVALAAGVELSGDVALRLGLNAHMGTPPDDDPAYWGAWVDGERVGLRGRAEWGWEDDPAVDPDVCLDSAALPAYVDGRVAALIVTATNCSLADVLYTVRNINGDKVDAWHQAVRVLAWMARYRERLPSTLFVMLAGLCIDGTQTLEEMEEKLPATVERAFELDAQLAEIGAARARVHGADVK